MAPYLHPTCVRSVWVRSALDRCINVVLTTKKVTKEVKKLGKMAILWLFLGHRDYLMAPRLLQHEYLLAPMIWSDFEHFRMSGSIICRQLLLSLTRCVRSASSFAFLAPFYPLKMSKTTRVQPRA